MSDPRITDKAVEEVAASMFEAVHELDWSQAEGVIRAEWLSRARAALEAALPHLAPQAMPTREQIAAAMHDHQMVSHGWRQGCREDVCIGIFLDRADAVLALLNGAES